MTANQSKTFSAPPRARLSQDWASRSQQGTQPALQTSRQLIQLTPPSVIKTAHRARVSLPPQDQPR